MVSDWILEQRKDLSLVNNNNNNSWRSHFRCVCEDSRGKFSFIIHCPLESKHFIGTLRYICYFVNVRLWSEWQNQASYKKTSLLFQITTRKGSDNQIGLEGGQKGQNIFAAYYEKLYGHCKFVLWQTCPNSYPFEVLVHCYMIQRIFYKDYRHMNLIYRISSFLSFLLQCHFIIKRTLQMKLISVTPLSPSPQQSGF